MLKDCISGEIYLFCSTLIVLIFMLKGKRLVKVFKVNERMFSILNCVSNFTLNKILFGCIDVNYKLENQNKKTCFNYDIVIIEIIIEPMPLIVAESFDYKVRINFY